MPLPQLTQSQSPKEVIRKQLFDKIEQIRRDLDNYDYLNIPPIPAEIVSEKLRIFSNESLYFLQQDRTRFAQSLNNIIRSLIDRLEKYLTDNPELDAESLSSLLNSIYSSSYDFMRFKTLESRGEARRGGLQHNEWLHQESARAIAENLDIYGILSKLGADAQKMQKLTNLIANRVRPPLDGSMDYVAIYLEFTSFLNDIGCQLDPLQAGEIIAEYIVASQLVAAITTKRFTDDLFNNIIYMFSHYFTALQIGQMMAGTEQ